MQKTDKKEEADKPGSLKSWIKPIALLSVISVELVVFTFLGLGLGYLLVYWLGWSKILLLPFGLSGFILGILRVKGQLGP